MTQQLPDMTIGVEDSEANPFGRDLPKEQKPPSFFERAADTAIANWYEGTLAGSAVAWGQHAYDLAVLNSEKGADTGQNLTSAQIASIRNKAYPEASTFSERAADFLGGAVGMAASPENFILPGVRAAETVIKGGQAAGKLFPKAGAAIEAAGGAIGNMPGIAQRMVDTGLGQMVVTALTNPVIQNNRIQAGLQREFDGWEMGLAPIEGFAMGAVLHGAFEGAGRLAKAGVDRFMGSSSGQAMQAGFEDRLRQNMMDRIKETDPGFKTPQDMVAPPPAEPVSEAPAAAQSEAGAQAGLMGDVSVMPAIETFADVAKRDGLAPGTSEYEARFKEWSEAQSEARMASEKARRVAEGQAAADRANVWRNRVVDWMKSARDGDVIEGDIEGERYILRVTNLKRTGEEVRSLVPDHEGAMPVVTLREGKPVGKIEATVDQNHGGREADSAGALDTIGKGLEEGTHKVLPAPPPQATAASQAAQQIQQAQDAGNLSSIPKADASTQDAPAVEGGPVGVYMFDPTTLKVDAKRFQFKEGGDEAGVTTALKSVTKWDPAKGNQVIVWQDKAGDYYVVDGHQRSGLARRLIESGKEKNVELPGLLYREADGVTAQDVRAIAAVKNIAEGSGSALDGAKVLRSRPDLMDGSLPLSAGKARQAAALSRLDDEAFRMIVNGVVEDHYGAIVGERIPNDGPRQVAAIKAISRFDPSNETEAAALVQRVAQAELEKASEGAQASLFGDLESADSTAGYEMKIVARAIKELKNDKTLFQRVVANASRIEETGSSIERAAAKGVTTEADMFARRLASDAYTPGPLRDALVAAARELKNEKIQIGEATARIRDALRRAAEDNGAARTGNRGGGEQPVSAGATAGAPISDNASDAGAGNRNEPAGTGGQVSQPAAPAVKRTKKQIKELFAPVKLAIKGWAFADDSGVIARLRRGEELVAQLPDDLKAEGEALLADVREAAAKIQGKAGAGKEPGMAGLPSAPSAYAVSGTFELRHGLSEQAAKNFEKTGIWEFKTEFEGPRFEDTGGVYGDVIYLDAHGQWTQPDLHGMDRWSIGRAINVEFSPKNALLVTPETLPQIRKDYGLPAIVKPEELTAAARTNGHDAIIIQGWDRLKNEGVTPDDVELKKEQLRAEYDKPDSFVNKGSWPDKEKYAEAMTKDLTPGRLAEARAWKAGLDPEGAQDQVLVLDPSIVKAKSVADISQKWPGIEFAANTIAVEPGAEGKPQGVIPGAERITDRELAERRASQPMQGGNEPAGGMFDQANTDQGDLQFRRGAPNYPPQAAREAVERRGQIIQSLQKQAFDLADLIGVPLRAGRVQQQALGQFEKKFGVARTRNVGDFAVVAHEMGHAIENKFGQDVTNIINRNAAELSPLDPNGTNSANEGFAEWVSTYLTNRAFATNQAPRTAADFTAFLRARDPGLLNGLNRAGDNFNAYLTAPAGERVSASVTPMEKQGWFADLKRTYKENGIAATIGRVLADSYTAVFDSYAPLNRAVRDLNKMVYERTGRQLVNLPAADNPEILMRMWMGRAAQASYYQERYGIVPYRGVTPVGPPLHDAIALATEQPGLLGKWDEKAVSDFSEYVTAKRANLLWDKYAAGEIQNPPTPFSQADAVATMQALAAANPNFERASQLVHEYTRQLLKKQLDAGLITKELYDKLAQEAFYVPLYRDVSDKPMASEGGGGSSPAGPGQTQTIRSLKGSSRDIIDPLQGLMQQTFLVERTIRHNDVIQSLVNLAERAGAPAGHLVEPVPAHEVKRMSVDMDEELRKLARQQGVSPLDTQLMMSAVLNTFNGDPLNATIFWKEPAGSRGEPIVFYKDAGQLKAVRFMGGKEGLALYESVMSLPPIGQDLFNATLALAGNVQRAGIVLNPTFMVANMIRDQMAVGILRPDYIPFWDGAKGVWSEATQNEAAQLYGYFGGQSAGAYVNEPSSRAKAIDLQSIAKKGYVAQHTQSLMDLAETVQITESGTRNSIFAKVYEQKLAQGLSPYEAAMEAAWAGTDILDFSRHGSKTFAVRQIVPFLNAHIQGIDKMRRTMLAPLWRAAKGDVLTVQEKQEVANAYASLFKFAVAGSALGVIWAAINHEDEVYRDADPKRKATHFVFSSGGIEKDIPKPFELSLGFTAGEQAFAAFVDRDPRAAGSMVTAAWEVLAPPNPLLDSPLVKAAFENVTGVDTYTRRDIVPEALQKLPEEMQYTERTSPLAIGISKGSKVISDFLNEATNKEFAGIVGFDKPWSPIKVEHMFGSGFGTTGRDMMVAAHMLSPGDDVTGGGWENTMFLRRFMKDPTRSSDTITRYYEHVAEKTGDYDKAKDGYNAAVKTGDMTMAQALYRNLDEPKKAYVVLNSGGDDEGASVFSGDEKKAHPMTRAREAVQQLNGIARELSNNSIANSETGEAIELSRPMRQSAIEAIHQLSAQEMRNALVMTNEPGYSGRKLLDVRKQYEVIKAVSPDLAEEVARRYAMAKVFTTEAVAAEWPAVQSELVRAGTQADISDRVGNISDAGYEFGGEHMPRRKLKRAPIAGEATAP